MKRILRGTVFLAVTAVLAGCGTEPDEVKGGVADHIAAEPTVVFIGRADSQAVRIRLEDIQGTSLHEPISISDVGAGINVRPDSAYRPIHTTGDSLVFNPEGTELRVWVSTSALASSSFTINAGGLTLLVPVVVTPGKDESFPFSTLTPALGEVVTASVTSDLLFTDSTKVLFGADTVGLTPVSVAADGSTLTFNAGPDLLGPATFTNVTLTYNKSVVFSVPAADTLNSPKGTQVFTFSNPTPDVGELITITPPAGVHFTAETEVTFDSAGPDPRFTIAADFASMTLEAGPNSVGPTTFTELVNPANTAFTFDLKSADTLVSAVVDTFQAAADDATPAVGQYVTITGGSSLFRFGDDAAFSVGDFPPLDVKVAADSNSAQVLFQPTSDDLLTEEGGLVSGFPLDLPTNVTITAAAVTQLAGTDAFATAPSLTVPAAAGDTTEFWDAGVAETDWGYDACDFFGAGAGCGAPARLYKLVLASERTLTYELPYMPAGVDLGIYLYDSTGAVIGGIADAGGGGAAETGDKTLAAGTYFVAVVWFPAAPPVTGYVLRLIGK